MNAPPTLPDDQELRALLPLWVSGRLSTEERARVQAWLDQSSEARAELAWWQAVHRDVRANTAQELADHDGDLGLKRFQQRLADLPPTPATGMKRQAGRGWSDWLDKLRAHWMGPALGACAVVILVQAVLLQQPASQGETLIPMSGSVPAGQGEFMVAFEPTATESDIRALLAAVHGEIVAGPSALGLYRVRSADDPAQVLMRLQAAKGTVADATKAP